MAVADRTGNAAKRRQGSTSYRNPANASFATAGNPYSSRYSAFRARGIAAAKQQRKSLPTYGDVSAHGSGYLQDAAYILNDSSGCPDEGDAAASSIARAAEVARDRAIDHALNRADLSEYDLDRPLETIPATTGTEHQAPAASWQARRSLRSGKAGKSAAPQGHNTSMPARTVQGHSEPAAGKGRIQAPRAVTQNTLQPAPAADAHLLQSESLPAARLHVPAAATTRLWSERYAAQQARKSSRVQPSAQRLAIHCRAQYRQRNRGLTQATHISRGKAAVSGQAVQRTISRADHAQIRQDCAAYRRIMSMHPHNAMLRHAARSIGMQKSLQIARTGSIYHVGKVSRGRAARCGKVSLGHSCRSYEPSARPKAVSFMQERPSSFQYKKTVMPAASPLHGANLQHDPAAALPAAMALPKRRIRPYAAQYGIELHRGSGRRVTSHRSGSKRLKRARIQKGGGRKRAEWLKKQQLPSLYRKNAALKKAAQKAGRAYQKANKAIYTATLFAPDSSAPDMGDAAASVPAKLVKETGRRAAGKTLRAAKSKLAARRTARTGAGTKASIRRANVRRMQKGLAKASGKGAGTASGTTAVRGLHDIGHNIVSVLKKVPQQITKDMMAAMGVAAGSPMLPLAAAIFGIIIIPSLIITIITAIIFPALNEQNGIGSLTGDAAELATFLKNDMGMNNAQAAAVIGNAVVESGNGSWTAGDPIVLGWGAIEGNGIGHGIFQWSFGRADALMALAQSQGKDWTDKYVQMQYFKSEWDSAWGLAQGSIDWYTDGEYSGIASKETFENETSVDMAALEFLAGWERPAKTTSHWKNRVACAQYIYSALESGAGGTINDGSLSGSQQAVISAAYATPSPGYGYCAAWVTNVFQNAGIGYFGGNACDMYNSWCTSSNLDDLKPGMIIAVSTHNLDAAGRIYGHVGIYIGNGQVMDNIGPIRTVDVNQWIQTFSGVVPAKWGWIGNIALT